MRYRHFHTFYNSLYFPSTHKINCKFTCYDIQLNLLFVYTYRNILVEEDTNCWLIFISQISHIVVIRFHFIFSIRSNFKAWVTFNSAYSNRLKGKWMCDKLIPQNCLNLIMVTSLIWFIYLKPFNNSIKIEYFPTISLIKMLWISLNLLWTKLFFRRFLKFISRLTSLTLR